MGSSSRAPPPAPLYIAGPNGTDAQSPTSPYDAAYSPPSYTTMPPHHRQSSSSSTATNSSTGSHSHKKPRSPTVNVYTTCGRHTDQFLFGGRSFSDMLNGVFNKKE